MGIRGQLCELPAVPQLVPPVRMRDSGHDAADGRVVEIEHTQSKVITQTFELPDGTKFNRAPKDMRSWEIHATYRLAWHLACFLPSAKLAQPLANWLCAAQRELENRGEWQPQALPPLSM
jgi:hypothetical protein